MGMPARGYTITHPPFEAGNRVAEKHGAWSARKVDPIAAELAAGIVEIRPDLDGPVHQWAVRAWARAEAQAALLETWLVDHGMLTEEGDPRPVMRLVGEVERRAADFRKALGLDPRSQAELARSRTEASLSAVDLDAVRAAGRVTIDAQTASGTEPPLQLADVWDTDDSDPEILLVAPPGSRTETTS